MTEDSWRRTGRTMAVVAVLLATWRKEGGREGGLIEGKIDWREVREG